MKVLVIEDNVEMADVLRQALEQSNFIVNVVDNGVDGHFEGEAGGYDAIVLDLGLPEMDGITVLEKWRKADVETPVIVITARGDINDVLKGLEAGADDYVIKGTNIGEVVARVQTNIKRSKGKMKNEIQYGDVIFDINGGTISKNNVKVTFTKLQFRLVQYLFLHQGSTVSIIELSEHIYDDFECGSNVIHRHISNIRKKLGKDVIATDSDRGYYVPLEK